MGGDEFTSFQTRARRALGKVEEKPDARDPLCSRNFQGLGKGVARCPERKSEGLFCLKNSGLGRGGELECPDAADCIEVFRPPFSGKSENFEPERLGTAEDFFVGFRQVFIEEVVVEVTRVTRPLESFFPSGCDCADQSGWGEIDAACPGGDEEFLESDPASLAVAFRVDPGDQSLAIDRDPDGMLARRIDVPEGRVVAEAGVGECWHLDPECPDSMEGTLRGPRKGQGDRLADVAAVLGEVHFQLHGARFARFFDFQAMGRRREQQPSRGEIEGGKICFSRAERDGLAGQGISSEALVLRDQTVPDPEHEVGGHGKFRVWNGSGIFCHDEEIKGLPDEASRTRIEDHLCGRRGSETAQRDECER